MWRLTLSIGFDLVWLDHHVYISQPQQVLQGRILLQLGPLYVHEV